MRLGNTHHFTCFIGSVFKDNDLRPPPVLLIPDAANKHNKETMVFCKRKIED